jgi:hypothetical protein
LQVKEPIPLNQQKTVLLDRDGHRVLLKGHVCLREGLLEMLLCLSQTKEHESVISLNSDAYLIHAALLLAGAEPGHPARYGEAFEPAEGDRIDINIHWTDDKGVKHSQPATKWIRSSTHRYFESPLESIPANIPTGEDDTLRFDEPNKLLLWYGTMTTEIRKKLLTHSDDEAYQKAVKDLHAQSQPRELKAEWVFGGSGFSKLEDGTQWYQAESGDVICVVNFGDALIDLSVASSVSNDNLNYEPYTERIPPVGTEVTVELKLADKK